MWFVCTSYVTRYTLHYSRDKRCTQKRLIRDVVMAKYDVVIRGGTIYDGSGSAGFTGDVAIDGQTIFAIGKPGSYEGETEIDASGLAVAPGFINMLSWAVESLIVDGRSQGDIRQGVTLEVVGEGFSMGPLSEAMKAEHPKGILGD